jgi:hypothetical protein
MKIYGYAIIGTGRGLSGVGAGALEFDSRITEAIEFREQYNRLPESVTSALFFRPVFLRDRPALMLVTRLHRSADSTGRRGFVGGCFLTDLIETYGTLFEELNSETWVNAITEAGAILRKGLPLPDRLLSELDIELSPLAFPVGSPGFHIGKQDSEYFALDPAKSDSVDVASVYAWAKTSLKESIKTFIFVEKGPSDLKVLDRGYVGKLYSEAKAARKIQSPKPPQVHGQRPLQTRHDSTQTDDLPELEPEIRNDRPSAYFDPEREIRALRYDVNQLTKTHEAFRKEAVLVSSLLAALIFLLFILFIMDKLFFS